MVSSNSLYWCCPWFYEGDAFLQGCFFVFYSMLPPITSPLSSPFLFRQASQQDHPGVAFNLAVRTLKNMTGSMKTG